MKKFVGFIALLSLGTQPLYAGERVGDFALIDHQGAFHHMAWYNDHNAVVILPQAVGATDSASLNAITTLQSAYDAQGVEFFLLNPGQTSDRAAVARDMAALGSDLPVLMDDAQLVADALGLTRLDEAVVYNPKNFEILYRGPAANVEATLQAVLAGDNPDLTAVATNGTRIQYSDIQAHAALSYERDIAPIIADNCAECHRDGGIAPFAMDSKLAVKGWSPMIREVVMTKRMPPGQIDNKVGYKMANEMNLSDDEMQKLVRWINAGANTDSAADPLAELAWPDTKWRVAAELGEPDLVVTVPPQHIPATGVVDYMDIPLDLGLSEDKWVRASEVSPDKAEVLHHIITTVVPPEGQQDPQTAFLQAINSLPEERAAAIRAQMFAAIAAGEQPNIDRIFQENPDIDVGFILGGGDPNQASVAGYAPGNSFTLNPEGVGGLLRAGSTLSLQMHYTTSGKEVTDETELAIWFYPQGVVPEERMSGGVGNAFTIAIPAQAKDHEMELATFFKNDSEIHSLMPHMHFRGKRMAFWAEYPDGTEELLLSVPAYSFNWQLSHELGEPLRVPAGTRIIARGAFDNSSQNTFNPDPNIEVNWGEQSWEEMFMGFYTWKELNQGGGED
ncbi:MAG: hypothetical protein RL120_11105 [Gammaproteobacteria bacterium]